MLSEISQTNIIQFHIHEVSEVVNFKETEQEGGFRGSGRHRKEKIRERGSLWNAYGVSDLEDDEVLELCGTRQ